MYYIEVQQEKVLMVRNTKYFLWIFLWATTTAMSTRPPTEDVTTSSTVLPLPNSTTTSSVELNTEELEDYMGAYILSTYQIGLSPTGSCPEALSITLEEDTLSIYKKSDLTKEKPTLLISYDLRTIGQKCVPVVEGESFKFEVITFEPQLQGINFYHYEHIVEDVEFAQRFFDSFDLTSKQKTGRQFTEDVKEKSVMLNMDLSQLSKSKKITRTILSSAEFSHKSIQGKSQRLVTIKSPGATELKCQYTKE